MRPIPLALSALLTACGATVTEPPLDAGDEECTTSEDCPGVVCCDFGDERVCLPAGDCEPDGEPR
jgi:hypothetical protein